MDEFSHYLPHRPVVKPSSSITKIRPVFDAYEREKNFPSLKQCLETGPNMIELILSVLLRFREKDIGVITDIKRAFLQTSIALKERDYLCFWWKRDGEMVAFHDTSILLKMEECFYSDNCVTSVDSMEELHRFIDAGFKDCRF